MFTWSSPATGGKPSQVTLELAETDGKTELVLTHVGLPSQEMADNHERGWTSILERQNEALAGE